MRGFVQVEEYVIYRANPYISYSVAQTYVQCAFYKQMKEDKDSTSLKVQYRNCTCCALHKNRVCSFTLQCTMYKILQQKYSFF